MQEETKTPSLRLCHLNMNGTGAALQMSVVPATADRDGGLKVQIAPQQKKVERAVPPTFDWEKAVKVTLTFEDTSKLLQVLRGECESLENGKGLYHQTAEGVCRIEFRHFIEPVVGYHLALSLRDGREAGFFMNTAEACGITEAISCVMGKIAFGL